MKRQKSRMKISDYFRLGRLSIKARKKSTRNTVFGMSFGLSLLIPMIFFALAFYIDMSEQFNDVKMATEITIPLKNVNDDSDSALHAQDDKITGPSGGIAAYSFYDVLRDEDGLTDYILAEYARLSFWTDLWLKVGDNEPINIGGVTGEKAIPEGHSLLKIMFPEKSTQYMFTNAELADYKNKTGRLSPLLYGSGFTKETMGKGEIIISETLLRKWGVNEFDITDYDKSISIYYPAFKTGADNMGAHGYRYDNDTIVGNVLSPVDWDDPGITLYLFHEFKVAGIIRSDYYDLIDKQNEAHMFVTSASVYFPEGDDEYAGIDYDITIDASNEKTVTFTRSIDDIIQLNQMDGYMALLQGFCGRYITIYEHGEETGYELNYLRLTMQYDTYNRVVSRLPQLKTLMKSAFATMTQNNFAAAVVSAVYNDFSTLDMIGNIMIIVFSVIGVIILFTNLLNLFNTIRYSVESRKYYIGVMRAIGAKSRTIPRLYICEILIIFFKTFIRVLIFATLISFGIKFGLNKAFSYLSDILVFNINILYYPLAFGGIFLLTLLVGIYFAAASSRKVAYLPILSTLYADK